MPWLLHVSPSIIRDRSGGVDHTDAIVNRFLFEGVVDGTERSCLVTGDLRAEAWYIDALLHNPLLAPYTIRNSLSRRGQDRTQDQLAPIKTLDCIYLDTSNVLLDEELVPKVSSAKRSSMMTYS